MVLLCVSCMSKKKNIPHSKTLEIDKGSDLVLCISSFVFTQNITTTRSDCNICPTTPGHGLSCRAQVGGWDTDPFVDCSENAKPIHDTIASNSILWFANATYRELIPFKHLLFPKPIANIFCLGDHHQPSAKDDSQNFQLTSDLYRRATESPIPNFVPQLPGLTSQWLARYRWAWAVG